MYKTSSSFNVLTDFIGNFVYENNIPVFNSYDEGRIVYQINQKYYAETHLKDHLGNIRAVFGNNGSGYGVMQTNTNYPFGMEILPLSEDSPSANNKNEYKFNGKMLQDELGLNWLDYGARFYDPIIGRWLCIDNLSDIYIYLSPYQYVKNNPLKYIDPDGNGSEITINGKQATMTINIVLYPGQGLGKSDVESLMQSSYSDYQSGQTYSLNVKNAPGLKFTNPNSSNTFDLEVKFNIKVMDLTEANEEFNTSDASVNFFMVGTDVGTEAGQNTSDENQPMVNTGVISTAAFGEENRTTAILAEEGWHTTNAIYTNGKAYGDHNLNPSQNIEGGDNSVCAAHVNSRTSTTVNQTDVNAVQRGQTQTNNGKLKGWPFKNNRAVNGDKSNVKPLREQ